MWTRSLLGVCALTKNYTELEYLESTGSQYIDTGYTINTSIDEVEIEIQGITTTVYKWFFGEHDSNARFGLGSGDGTNRRNMAYGPTTYKVSDVQLYDTKHTFISNSQGCFLDGTKICDFTSFSSTSTIYLFNLNLNNQSSYMSGARIWKYTHKRNGKLIRDLVAAVDKNGVVCMYCKASKQFLYNLGSDVFIGGPKAGDVPEGCVRLNYIESTGTQWIDTGIKLTSNHSVELDYQLTETTQYRKGLFGILTSDASVRFGSILSPSNAYLEHGYGAGNIYYQTGLPDTQRHVIRQENNLVYFDDILIYTFNFAKFTSNISAPLCNFTYTNYAPAKARYFYSRWWNGNTIVREFIPCLDPNGVVCMYDKISGTFFYNKGTGTFIAG